MPSLSVLVYGCATKPRYLEELQSIDETYKKHCDANGVPLYVFLEEQAGVEKPHYIRLPGVPDTYESNVPKTFLGLKWMMEHVTDLQSVLVIGTDSYPNIPKLLRYLKTLDTTQPLYIGGHGGTVPVYGEETYFHSGGGGFVLTRPLLDQLYPLLAFIPRNWSNLCMNTTFYKLMGAGDVAAAYYIYRTCKYEIVYTPGVSFSGCDHRGYPCHIGVQEPKTILCCHLMTRDKMLEFTSLLEQNNFFL